MPCIVSLDTYRHYRELDRRDECAKRAELARDDLLNEWIEDMTHHSDEMREMLKRLIDESNDFFDTLMLCEKLATQKELRDVLLAGQAYRIGIAIHEQVDRCIGRELQDEEEKRLLEVL